MNIGQYNLVPRAKKAIQMAVDLAIKYKHGKVNCAHLVLCLLQTEASKIKALVEKFNINLEKTEKVLMVDLAKEIPRYFQKAKQENSWSEDFDKTLKDAQEFSIDVDHQFIGVEHILFAFFQDEGMVVNFLQGRDFPTEAFMTDIIESMNPQEETPKQQMASVGSSEEESKNEKKESFLKKYCSNVNESVAKQNDQINGRDAEIDRLIEVLSCKVKNNAMLLGEAGVGKTACIQGLAQRINEHRCPIFLSGMKVYSLDVGLLVAGTRYRGQFEDRLKGVIEEVQKDESAILFIDEIHAIVGAGSAEGSLDLANIIKPSLARGELKCIGATTRVEYKKYFEKDAALVRRFQTIDINEPNKERTFEILAKARVNYEKFHGVSYSDEMIEMIISLAEKYLPYRRFPDKAFDILDRIGANGKIEKFKIPDSLKKLEGQLVAQIEAEFSEEESEQLPKEKTKKKSEGMLQQFAKKRDAWIKKTVNTALKVDEDNLKNVIASISGIPKEKLEIGTARSILSLKQDICTQVFDQDEAIEKIYNILLCSKAGIKKQKKTLANLLFVGGTGVGKTHMAKVIAETVFNKPNSFLQIDMAEYIDKASISKLLGASAGYIGYEEGGLLSEFVRNNPNSLILFDEVEKAHADVLNILLKIMDEGWIIDSFNRKIDFSGTIIVMTGNVGAEAETARSMGFVEPPKHQSRIQDYNAALERHFKPELLSRVDEKIIFNSEFSDSGLSKMIDVSIRDIETSLKEKDIEFLTPQETLDFLLKEIKGESSNARAVQKIIRQKLELPLAHFVVSNKKLKKITSKVVDSEIKFI